MSIEKNVASLHVQHFSPFILSFSWQIVHLKNVDMYTFSEGMGTEKVYVLYTHLNVDNYGQSHIENVEMLIICRWL